MKKTFILIVFLFTLRSLNAQMVFLERPENFKPELEVATCYVIHGGKALFLKRCASSTWSQTWGLPGGKIEENQTPLETMLREVFEETTLDLSQEKISFLGKVYVRDPKKDFVYHMFKCDIPSKPNNILLARDEHLEYKWLEPNHALQELLLVPGEDECINLLFGNRDQKANHLLWGLDKTFGMNGIVTTDFGINSGTFNRIVPSIHVKVQCDGKIIMIGDVYKDYENLKDPNSCCALVRYNPDGSLDKFFGKDGKLILPLAQFNSYGIDLALQHDGKIVLVGRIFEKEDYFSNAAVVRLNHDGTLDQSFGVNGIVCEKNRSRDNWSNFFRITLQDDGKIVTAGNQGLTIKEGDNHALVNCTLFVARYNSDGSPDLNFGDKGKIKTVFKSSAITKSRVEGREADEASSVCLQSDGKIVVVGRIEDSSEVDLNYFGATKSTDCAIARYEPNGQLDTSFGPDKTGMVVTSLSKDYNFFVDVLVRPDSKIIALGISRNSDTNKDEFALVRYTNDGILDTEFGNNGIVLTALGSDHSQAKNLLLQSDGKILVTGHAQYNTYKKFTLVRYNFDGSLDRSFGTNKSGTLITTIGDLDDRSFSVAIQPDKKLVVSGDSFNGKNYDFALVRYNAQ